MAVLTLTINLCMYLFLLAGSAIGGLAELGLPGRRASWAVLYLLRVAGSARGRGTVGSGQGDLQKMSCIVRWSDFCLSLSMLPY